ncbi:MAG: MFS transporter [Bacteroidales bacterium]|nr:MFS transporter [Bacteroidales bacterium]
MKQQQHTTNKPWKWVPSLYFAEGLPYVIVMVVATIMYKNLGLSNRDIALYTSWLYLPWVIKPIWSPIVDILFTKKKWIIVTQTILCIAFATVAFLIPTPFYLQATLAAFWIMAFASATHDIAADGFYIAMLNEGEQSFFIGIRNTFYRIASITGQGLLVMIAGKIASTTQSIPLSWSIVFLIVSAIFLTLMLWHLYALPNYEHDTNNTHERKNIQQVFNDLGNTFVTFFCKKNILFILFFILTYRLGEAQLGKIAQPFMLDNVEKGGLAISTELVGFLYGTIGVVALLVGGILGGWAISQWGLRKSIIPMALAMNIPDLLYFLLAQYGVASSWLIGTCVAVEQLGYGFGYTAFSMYLIFVSEGEHKTAHYSFGTGLMALGMMLPGMAAGWIEEQIGYAMFFLWVCVCTIPGILAAAFSTKSIPTTFGKTK